MRSKFFYILFFILLFYSINAQIDTIGYPLVKNYSAFDYNGHYQNWYAVQDKSGIMYFANGSGIMTFDGVNWELLELPNQKTPRSLSITDSGKIYVAGDNLLGYLSVDSVNNLKYISILDSIPEKHRDFRTIWELKSSGNSTYAYSTHKIFKIYNNNKIKIFQTDIANRGLLISSENKVYIDQVDSTILIINNDSLYSLNLDYNVLDFYEKNDTVFAVTTKNQILYFNNKDQVNIYKNFKSKVKGILVSDFLLYKKKYFLYSTYKSGIYIIDLKGHIITHLTRKSGLTSNSIYNVYIDNLNNIWLQTSAGISFIEEALPIRMIDKRLGIAETHSAFTIKFNEKIYSSIGEKFYSIKLGNNEKTESQIIEEIERQCWDADTIGDELYISHNPFIFRIDKKENVKQYGPVDNIWTIEKIPQSDNKYYVSGNNGIYLYQYNGDSLKFIRKISTEIKNVRRLFFEDSTKLWLAITNTGVYKVELNQNDYSFKNKVFYGKDKGLLNLSTITFFKNNDILFISTYKNLFFYNPKKDSIEIFNPIVKNFNIKDKRILQLIEIDDKNNFWFEYYNDDFEAEIFCFKKQNDTFVQNNTFAKRLMNFSIGFIKNYTKEKLIFGTRNGLAFLNLNNDFNVVSKYKSFVRKLYFSDKDSLLYGGNILTENGGIVRKFTGNEKITVDFKNNNLRFIYAAPYFVAPEKTRYRVKLKNYDKNWTSWSYETKKDYTNLPPGNYTFLVEAKNIFGIVSTPIPFEIQIKHPWYRTIYAYFAYSIIVVLFLIGIVKFFTYRLKRRNEKLEELVDERTKEIQLKNSELEQQKEEILTQAEELQIVNQELEKLSTIVRETDNAVILTDKDGNFIWINNAFTKMFGYTLEELVTQVSPNIISDQTDEKIKKTVNRCISEKVTVEYELKVKNKFDKEIWVHTTLTPILDDQGQITSLIAIDADITAIKLAEKQIMEQSEQITSSIKYARTIQESVLPTNEEIDNIFDNFVIFKPKDIVSGDFYWISNLFTTIDNKLTHVRDDKPKLKIGYTNFFAVVDCTGHGVPGAFMSLIGSHLLGEIINEQRYSSPKIILEQLDKNLSKALKRSNTRNYDGMVISLCRFDKIIKNENIKVKVTFAGAKQHITYYKKSNNSFTKLRGSARQIGFVINEDLQFLQETFYLDKGDSLFMYTDGLKDLNNPDRESFGHSKIRKILEKNINKPVKEIGKTLKIKMKNWLDDDDQRDDITFIGLRIK